MTKFYKGIPQERGSDKELDEYLALRLDNEGCVRQEDRERAARLTAIMRQRRRLEKGIL